MTNKQINIGILQSAGIAGRIIETALNHPEITDVFTPVIYSKENQNDKNVGADLKFGNIAAVVVAPGSTTEFNFPGALSVYIDGTKRIACLTPSSEELAVETATEIVKKAWNMLQRDFIVSMPRIAIVLPDDNQEATTETSKQLVREMTEEGIYLFGPFTSTDYKENCFSQHFDLTLVVGDDVMKDMTNTQMTDMRTRFIAGIPMVMTQTDYNATFEFDETNLNEPANALRQAAYLAIEISNNRISYDESHADPLQKLYHERRDDSEKVRFAIPKKKTEEKE